MLRVDFLKLTLTRLCQFWYNDSMERRKTGEAVRIGLFLTIAIGGAIVASEYDDSPQKVTGGSSLESEQFVDHTVECNVNVVPTHGGLSYKYVKDPAHFTEPDHPAHIPLIESKPTNNLVRGTVIVGTKNYLRYLDVVEIHTKDRKFTIDNTTDVGYSTEEQVHRTYPIELSGANQVEGRSGHLTYTISRKRGSAVIEAACDDSFIEPFNQHMEDIYQVNDAPKVMAVTP